MLPDEVGMGKNMGPGRKTVLGTADRYILLPRLEGEIRVTPKIC